MLGFVYSISVLNAAASSLFNCEQAYSMTMNRPMAEPGTHQDYVRDAAKTKKTGKLSSDLVDFEPENESQGLKP
jgi:hypothetical protein